MTRALVVGRRRKGRKIGKVVREVERLLRDAGWKVEGEIVTRKSGLRRRAARAVKDHCDVVVAVGGDGAVLQVVTALAESKVALGIIPTGTGNLLAGNLKIPHRPDSAVRVLLTGRRRRIDLGRVTVDGADHDFAVACGVGFDAEVMEATGTAQKLHWGKFAYLANAIGQSGEVGNFAIEMTLDGVTSSTEAAQVFIANFGRMLPVIAPRRSIPPDDGLLDVILVRASGPLHGLLASWEVLLQTELGESRGGHVLRAQAREIRIDTTPSRLVETDGSVIGKTPLVARILPAALTVMVPKK